MVRFDVRSAIDEGKQVLFLELITSWLALQEASRIMVLGPAPTWPWSEDHETFLAQQRRRDRVQGIGMRFAAEWRSCADAIRSVVSANPGTFPEFHIAPKKGDVPDPTSYSHAGSIVGRILRDGL